MEAFFYIFNINNKLQLPQDRTGDKHNIEAIEHYPMPIKTYLVLTVARLLNKSPSSGLERAFACQGTL